MLLHLQMLRSIAYLKTFIKITQTVTLASRNLIKVKQLISQLRSRLNTKALFTMT